ncbi:hypothetical protein KGF54_005220 [Candida jiufengensis]|uniref:uncharacterized protein n=1 Tax=Candida jiufengensis TaxID=497108 RepID=UPI0022258249|nr:uncharacterized protein KGF54_005220 [Candida jiufengensis]KAI5950263.1 hypothetical protein KGF54_005220 [Candida jiufengensis]
MTVSPNQNQIDSSASLKQSPILNTIKQPSSDVLTEERASNIGWYFIKSYYNFFITKLDDIHKIYHQNASILHDSFPDQQQQQQQKQEDYPITFKANGTESIKKCFNEYLSNPESQSINRILITSASFQVSLDKNIIIVTFGEWSKNDSPFKQFTQYFVLTPGKRESTYDVANDILKFVENNGYKENSEILNNDEEIKNENLIDNKEQQQQAEIIDEKPVVVADTGSNPSQPPAKEDNNVVLNGSKEETKVEAQKDLKQEKQEDEKTKTTESNEIKEESNTSLEENTSISESPVVAKSEPSEISKETKESSTETDEENDKNSKESPGAASTPTAAPAKSSQPLSWADLAYQAVPATTIKSTGPKPTPKSTTTATSTQTKKNPSSTTNSQQQNGTSTSNSNVKYKKDEWYPIYIRGARNTDEKLLKEHIVKNFGELKFFRVNQNIALCDFVLKDAQKRALEAKETTINGFTINLEPRESKTGNNYYNNSNSGNFNNKNKKNFNNNNNEKEKDKKFGGGSNNNGGNGQNNGNLKINDKKLNNNNNNNNNNSINGNSNNNNNGTLKQQKSGKLNK